MDVKKVINELRTTYPDKKIVVNNDQNPTEIICEIEPASNNPDKSVAVAVVDKSVAHFHRLSTEEYEVIRGNLKVKKNGKVKLLHPGQRIRIKPGEYHSAKGKETWIRVTSSPAWSLDDHFLVK